MSETSIVALAPKQSGVVRGSLLTAEQSFGQGFFSLLKTANVVVVRLLKRTERFSKYRNKKFLFVVFFFVRWIVREKKALFLIKLLFYVLKFSTFCEIFKKYFFFIFLYSLFSWFNESGSENFLFFCFVLNCLFLFSSGSYFGAKRGRSKHEMDERRVGRYMSYRTRRVFSLQIQSKKKNKHHLTNQ